MVLLSFVYQSFLRIYNLAVNLFSTPGNASLGEVVNRNLDGNAVTGQNSYIIHPELS